MKEVSLYTDGACSCNPGAGGWACILVYNQHEKTESGAEPETTNNRMEIKAVLEGLKLLNQPCIVTVYSDSSYVCNAFEKKWIENWKRNGWLTSSKTPVQNQDLWNELIDVKSLHQVKFVWVKGHASNEYNNRCDSMARAAIDTISRS